MAVRSARITQTATAHLPIETMCVHCPDLAGAEWLSLTGLPADSGGVRAVHLQRRSDRCTDHHEWPLLRPEEFWCRLTDRLSRRRTLWVVGLGIYERLLVLGLANQLHSRELIAESWVHDSRVTVLSLVHRRGKCLVVDLGNYCDRSTLSGACGSTWLDAVAETWIRICRFIARHHCGSMRATIGGQAWAAYRAGRVTEPVVPHTDQTARQIERAGYYAGHCDCHRVGRVEGEIYVLDANSLYPYCAQEHELPVRLLCCRAVRSEELYAHLAGGGGAIAQVEIDSPDTTYPVRRDGHTHWARGRFRTCLPGPELWQAIESGHVRSVGLVCLYAMGRPLAGYMEEIYALRLEYRNRRCHVEESLCKGLLNSLIGRFGRRQRVWTPRPGHMPREWYGSWSRVVPGQTGATVCRWTGGHVEEQVRTDDSAQAFPALAAYVTSYGRLRMRALYETLESKEVYYEDCDSLHTNRAGAARICTDLRGDRDRLGGVKVAGPFTDGYYRGPRSYLLGDPAKGKTAGIVWRNAAGGDAQVNPLDGVSRRYAGRVGPDGWIDDLVLD